MLEWRKHGAGDGAGGEWMKMSRMIVDDRLERVLDDVEAGENSRLNCMMKIIEKKDESKTYKQVEAGMEKAR